jgi:hypothetical protein
MAFYEFKYLHQTAEHCTKRPLPDNVSIAGVWEDTVVYSVDLPASVWAVVEMSITDPYRNTIERFPSPSLRADWIEARLDSLQRAIP